MYLWKIWVTIPSGVGKFVVGSLLRTFTKSCKSRRKCRYLWSSSGCFLFASISVCSHTHFSPHFLVPWYGIAGYMVNAFLHSQPKLSPQEWFLPAALLWYWYTWQMLEGSGSSFLPGAQTWQPGHGCIAGSFFLALCKWASQRSHSLCQQCHQKGVQTALIYLLWPLWHLKGPIAEVFFSSVSSIFALKPNAAM